MSKIMTILLIHLSCALYAQIIEHVSDTIKTIDCNDIGYQNNSENYRITCLFSSASNKKADKIDAMRKKIKCYERIYRQDTSNIEIIQKLARNYYWDFLRPFWDHFADLGFLIETRNGQPDSSVYKNAVIDFSIYENSAEKSLYYLNKLYEYDAKYNYVYYPIQQIITLIGLEPLAQYDNSFNSDFHCHFSPEEIVSLKDNWRSDSTVDYMYFMKDAFEHCKYYGIEMKRYNEPCIKGRITKNREDNYRFVWWRHFWPSIILRLEVVDDDPILHWTIIDKEVTTGRKTIKKQDYLQFILALESVDFEESVRDSEITPLDAEQWYFEYSRQNEYSAFTSNNKGYDIFKTALLLIEISELKIAGIN